MIRFLLAMFLCLCPNAYADFNTGDTFGKGMVIQANGVTQTGGGRTLNFASGTTVTVNNNAYQITASGSSSGNVGIGTVGWNAYYAANGSTVTASKAIFTDTNSNVGIGTTTPQGSLVVTNGNVGIGTWAPAQKLDINGNLAITAGATGNMYIGQATDSTSYNLISLNSNTTIASGEGIFGQSSGDNTMYVQGRGHLALRGRGDFTTNMSFDQTSITSTLTSGNFLINGGNVGIGSINPGKQLDVNGTVRLTGFVLTGGASNGYVLTSDASGNGTWGAASGGGTPGTPISGIQYNNGGSFGAFTTFTTNGTNVGIGTAGYGSRLTVLGNLGVGTTNGDVYLTTAASNGGAIFYGNVGIGTWIPSASLFAASGGAAQIAASGSPSLANLTITYLVVAGGGGGGFGGGGGGGAGGLLASSLSISSGNAIAVTVGNGGSGATSGGALGSNGQNSVFSSATAIGGGVGSTATNPGSGGSGGGDELNNNAAAGTGTGGQGNNGGIGNTTNPFPAGGGGGASAAGAAGSGSQSGKGGDGSASSITGGSITYAGGGGGGASTFGAARGVGGTGGGGAGGTGSGGVGTNGTTNLGGGGGAGASGSGGGRGGDGGSGVVILSYPTPSVDGTGGSITHSGGNTIHTFNSSGTFTPPNLFGATPTILFESATNVISKIQADNNAGTLNIYNNNIQAQVINSVGNVGIGSVNPGQTLDVQGTARVIQLFDTGIAASKYVYQNASQQLTAATVGTGLADSSGTLSSNATSFVSYQPGLLSAVNSTIGVNYKFSKASTVDNLIGSAVTFSCVANPTITMYECGVSTTCAGPTTIGTVTVTAAGTLVVGTVTNSAITAGDYIGWAITAGTCASVDIAATAQVHSN